MGDALIANILVYLMRYAIIVRQFFKSKYVHLLMEILKWEILAYSFTFVNGYSATLCYMFLIVYEVMKFTLISKNIVMDVAVFLICASFIYLSRKYHIIYLLPYIALFINMVIKPILAKFKKDNKYTNMLIDLLVCIYSYNYHLYVLFIFKLFQIIFPIVGLSIKNVTDKVNKRIN